MQLEHRRLHLAVEQQPRNVHAARERLFDQLAVRGGGRIPEPRRRLCPQFALLFDQLAVRGGGRIEDIVGDEVPVARMTDADAQAPEPRAAELGGDVLQAVVAGHAAAELELRRPRRKVELVVHHQHLLREHLVEARERSDGFARKVHVGLGKHEAELAAGPRELAYESVVLGDGFQLDTLTGREPGHEPEAHVVAVALVVLARIPEACNQFDHWTIQKGRGCRRALSGGDEVRYFLSAFSPFPPLPPLSSAAGAAGSGAFCLTVGTSAAAGTASAGAATPSTLTAAAAAAAASSSAIAAFGICAEATVGFSLPPRASSTPFGMATSRTWIEWPIEMFDRSTWTNSGRSAGRQRISMSFRTWVMRPPCSLIAGDFSALTKCSGTLMWIFWSAATRWKSMCCTSAFHGCMLTARSRTCCFAPSSASVRMDAWNFSSRSWWNKAF